MQMTLKPMFIFKYYKQKHVELKNSNENNIFQF